MNKQFNMIVELTPEDVKEAIAEYIDRNFPRLDLGVGAHNVSLIVGSRLEGMGPMEHSVEVFEKAVVKIKKPGSYQDR